MNRTPYTRRKIHLREIHKFMRELLNECNGLPSHHSTQEQLKCESSQEALKGNKQIVRFLWRKCPSSKSYQLPPPPPERIGHTATPSTSRSQHTRLCPILVLCVTTLGRHAGELHRGIIVFEPYGRGSDLVWGTFAIGIDCTPC